jgi:hypothetical protein
MASTVDTLNDHGLRYGKGEHAMPRKLRASTTPNTVLQVPRAYLEMAERLVPAMERDPQHMAHGMMSKSVVARLAMLRGLQALAKEHAVELTAPGGVDGDER